MAKLIDGIKVRDYNEVMDDSMVVIRNLEDKYKNDDNYYFDTEQAIKYIRFVGLLKHTAGSLGGVNFQLLPFQVEFISESLCVKKKSTGLRRFKTAILHISRKNGKSELLGAIIVLMFFLDKEKSKQIFTIASETEQAKIVFNAAQSMIKQTNYLEKMVNMYKSTRSIESKGEFLDVVKVLTSNAETKDGLRNNVLIADEPHSYRDDSLYKVIEESQVSRLEPITFMISTAGYNLEGMYYQKLQYAKKVKEGIIKDDSMYSMIFEADPKDWHNEEQWIKANPAIGYGVRIENLRDMYTRALHSATEKTSFLTKHLNIWVNSSHEFIADDVWVENMGTLPDDDYLKKLTCYAGLDLSSVTDITAYVKIFIDKDKIYIKPMSYLPKDAIDKKARTDRVSYEDWASEGFMTLTDGNVVDYSYIQRDIENDMKKYKIKHIGFDRWNSHDVVTRLLERGVPMVAFGQGYSSMSAPCKMIERMALERKFVSECSVLRWCISNIEIEKDAADNIKFSKAKSRNRIDVAVALAMAIGMYIPDIVVPSAYATRGLRML